MGTDQLIELISNVSNKLLPVAGLVLFVFLIVFVSHLIKTLKTLHTTLVTTNKMIEDCNVQVNKLDGPLATANELSQTVDQVHCVTKNALSSTIAIVLNNLDAIRDWVKNRKNSESPCDDAQDVESEGQ